MKLESGGWNYLNCASPGSELYCYCRCLGHSSVSSPFTQMIFDHKVRGCNSNKLISAVFYFTMMKAR